MRADEVYAVGVEGAGEDGDDVVVGYAPVALERMERGVQSEGLEFGVYVVAGEVMFGAQAPVVAGVGVEDVVDVVGVACLADAGDDVLNHQCCEEGACGPAEQNEEDDNRRGRESGLSNSSSSLAYSNRITARLLRGDAPDAERISQAVFIFQQIV